MSVNVQSYREQIAELQTEIATLKRQHEQLRAAAEPVRELLRMLALQYAYMHKIEMQPLYANLDAALGATPAEPARETFDPDAVRALLQHIESFSDPSEIRAELAQAVRDSERK